MKGQSWTKTVKQLHSGSDVVPRRSTSQSEPEPLVQLSRMHHQPTAGQRERRGQARRCGVKEYVRYDRT